MWLRVTTRLSGSKERKNSRLSHCAQRLWLREVQKHLYPWNVPWILQPFGYFGKTRGYPFWLVILIFAGFWICGWVWNSIFLFLLICLSFDAGIGIERALSCGYVVGVADELDEERAADRPGTTIHTQSSASRWIRTHSYTCFLAIGPLLWISVNLEELSEREHCSRIFDDFYSQESIQFSDVKMSPLHASALFPLAVMTVVGHLEIITISTSAEFKSFLLIMSTDASESTTNSLSSSLILNGEERHHFSVIEKNAALCFSFNSRLFFASLHTASRAQCSCHSVSSWDRSSDFGALGLRWW